MICGEKIRQSCQQQGVEQNKPSFAADVLERRSNKLEKVGS
jgi:hypothetical protein